MSEDAIRDEATDELPRESEVPVAAIERFYELYDIYRNLRELQERFSRLASEFSSVIWRLWEEPVEGPIEVWAHNPTLTPSEQFRLLLFMGLTPQEIATLGNPDIMPKHRFLKTLIDAHSLNIRLSRVAHEVPADKVDKARDMMLSFHMERVKRLAHRFRWKGWGYITNAGYLKNLICQIIDVASNMIGIIRSLREANIAPDFEAALTVLVNDGEELVAMIDDTISLSPEKQLILAEKPPSSGTGPWEVLLVPPNTFRKLEAMCQKKLADLGIDKSSLNREYQIMALNKRVVERGILVNYEPVMKVKGLGGLSPDTSQQVLCYFGGELPYVVNITDVLVKRGDKVSVGDPIFMVNYQPASVIVERWYDAINRFMTSLMTCSTTIEAYINAMNLKQNLNLRPLVLPSVEEKTAEEGILIAGGRKRTEAGELSPEGAT